MVISSEAVASVGVADRQHEEAEPKSQQHQIQHLDALLRHPFGAAPQIAQGGNRHVLRCTNLDSYQTRTKTLFAPLAAVLVNHDICFRDGWSINVIGISYRCRSVAVSQ